MADQNLQTRLETERDNVKKELQSLGVQNPQTTQDWIPTPEDPSDSEPDPNVVADRSEDWNERRGTLDQLETRFNNLNRALKKIETNTYGPCEICGAQIETDRLEANPAARTCKTHLEDEANLSL